MPSEAEVRARTQLIGRRRDFQDRVGEATAQRYPDRAPPIHAEEQIFDAFPTPADMQLADQFHQTPWSKRQNLLMRISDKRMQELDLRLIAHQAPNELLEEEAQSYGAYLDQRRFGTGQTTDPRTVSQAITECDDQLAACPAEERDQLHEIRDWLIAQKAQRQPSPPNVSMPSKHSTF